MKVAANFGAEWRGGEAVLRPRDPADIPLLERLFKRKAEREAKAGAGVALRCELSLDEGRKTAKQNATAWKCVELIFRSMEGRNPSEGERRETYEDLLEAYADRVPSRVRPRETRPVHLSRMTEAQASRFVDALLCHLAEECGLAVDVQADARGVMFEWEMSRGGGADWLDGARASEWRPVYSEASGVCGGVDKHHILPRGAFPQFADCGWNVMALTRQEHEYFHAVGAERFLARYPHLRSRVEKARAKGGMA